MSKIEFASPSPSFTFAHRITEAREQLARMLESDLSFQASIRDSRKAIQESRKLLMEVRRNGF